MSESVRQITVQFNLDEQYPTISDEDFGRVLTNALYEGNIADLMFIRGVTTGHEVKTWEVDECKMCNRHVSILNTPVEKICQVCEEPIKDHANLTANTGPGTAREPICAGCFVVGVSDGLIDQAGNDLQPAPEDRIEAILGESYKRVMEEEADSFLSRLTQRNVPGVGRVWYLDAR